MSRFGPAPRSFFDAVYAGAAPWDIGEVQPGMAALLAEYPPDGPALDVGCGPGDLAVHLAKLGLPTLGVDFVDTAVEQALARRNALPPDIAQRLDFRVADALCPSRLGQAFETVVDSGFFHLFTPDECDQYVEDLARAIRPGGRLYLHEFAVEFPIPNVPRAVTEAEVRERFVPDRGWQVVTIRSGEFLSRVAPAPTPAILACVERVKRLGA